MKNCHLAVDIGASSGRHIVGWTENGQIRLREIYRFENGVRRVNGHLCWDLEGLRESVIEGIAECGRQGFAPSTMGIDTWAVDFVLLDKDGKILGDTVAYRDERTDPVRAKLEADGILQFGEHYRRTGIQYQKFNTIYQLRALQEEHPEYFEQAQDFLMIPDYLHYCLTGVKANEYTNATTTSLVEAATGKWDSELLARLGLPERIFREIVMPGTVLGRFTEEMQARTGLNPEVVVPATHDTGSAFLAVPAKDENAVFLSSGTWSLVGVENRAPITTPESCAANFTNEGGYEFRYRYLKNIMGLWMIQSVRRNIEAERRQLAERGELPAGMEVKPSFPELIAAAESEADFRAVLDVDDDRFLAPDNMMEEIRKACADNGLPVPQTTGQVMQCIYQSLADDYRRTIETLSGLTGKKYTSLNIVGGGCQDMLLNRMTAKATGLPVYAGPVEGTALGNLIVQFLYAGEYADLQAARDAIRESFEIREIRA